MNSLDGVEWPNWSGETAIVIATGPSAADQPLHLARDRTRCIVIKSSWQLVPWADVLYGSDRGWWVANGGVPEFEGTKISASPSIAKLYPGIGTVSLVKTASILTDEVGRIGCGSRLGGGHSGFHALNLAVQFGVKRIVLVGFDMTAANGLTKDWRSELDACAGQFSALGVRVVNASPLSALTAYPKVDLLDEIHGLANARGAYRPRHRVDVEREPVAIGAGGDPSGVRGGADRGSQADEPDDPGASAALHSSG